MLLFGPKQSTLTSFVVQGWRLVQNQAARVHLKCVLQIVFQNGVDDSLLTLFFFPSALKLFQCLQNNNYFQHQVMSRHLPESFELIEKYLQFNVFVGSLQLNVEVDCSILSSTTVQHAVQGQGQALITRQGLRQGQHRGLFNYHYNKKNMLKLGAR